MLTAAGKELKLRSRESTLAVSASKLIEEIGGEAEGERAKGCQGGTLKLKSGLADADVLGVTNSDGEVS